VHEVRTGETPVPQAESMDSHKLSLKFFVENPSGLKTDEDFVPVFHRWIQTRALPGHQLIDVADYAHVKEGPGTVLVAHEANFHADLGGGRLGLLYVRKQPLASTSFAQRLRETFAYALRASALLEDEESLRGRIRFRTDEAAFRIYDRLQGPDTQETFNAVRGDLEKVLRDLWRADVQLAYQPHPENLFEVTLRAAASVSVSTLLERASQ
jgi:hypothetical protein